jgi:hypothetical protein
MAATEAVALESVLIEGKSNRGQESQHGTFKISDLRSKVGAVARPNLFTCYLDGSSVFESEIPNFSFRCEKAEFPGRTIATTDDTFSGPTLKLPYDMTYNDITLSIICSEDMKERRFFERWMDLIVKPARQPDAGTVAYHSEYARGLRLVVEQLDSNNRILASYACYDPYPIAITPMNATWDEVNTYQRFGVTLTYRYHNIL